MKYYLHRRAKRASEKISIICTTILFVLFHQTYFLTICTHRLFVLLLSRAFVTICTKYYLHRRPQRASGNICIIYTFLFIFRRFAPFKITIFSRFPNYVSRSRQYRLPHRTRLTLPTRQHHLSGGRRLRSTKDTGAKHTRRSPKAPLSNSILFVIFGILFVLFESWRGQSLVLR